MNHNDKIGATAGMLAVNTAVQMTLLLQLGVGHLGFYIVSSVLVVVAVQMWWPA
jgi:hypothetical protein